MIDWSEPAECIYSVDSSLIFFLLYLIEPKIKPKIHIGLKSQ